MKKIEILGPGCNNCQRLEANAREAVATAGIDADIVKVVDYAEIMRYGIMSTPGLVIDGKTVSYGRIPSAGDIAAVGEVGPRLRRVVLHSGHRAVRIGLSWEC